MKRAAPRIGLFLIAATLIGCGEEDVLAPPTIHYGQDVCAVCNMIISDDRYAAAAITQTGERFEKHAFDDIGCLLVFESEAPADARLAKRYVLDFEASVWMEAQQAVFAHSVQLHSPMAFGTAACSNRDAAQRLSERYPGDVLTFDELCERFTEGTLDIDPFQETPSDDAGISPAESGDGSA